MDQSLGWTAKFEWCRHHVPHLSIVDRAITLLKSVGLEHRLSHLTYAGKRNASPCFYLTTIGIIRMATMFAT